MKYAKIAATLEIVAATITINPAPSMAFGLPKIKIGKALTSVGNAVTHPARTVKDAGKVVANVVTHPQRSAKDFGKAYMKVARPVGNAVGKAYDAAAAVSKRVDILKPAVPLAKVAAKIARSKVGQIGFGVGAGTALVGGGVAAVSHLGTSGGMGAVAAHYISKGVNAAAKEGKRFKSDIRAALH